MMSPFKYPKIVNAETLSTGVMVHFEGAESVFFSAHFLYEQRNAPGNKIFRDGINGAPDPTGQLLNDDPSDESQVKNSE